jgi:GTP cyclohydrolase IB
VEVLEAHQYPLTALDLRKMEAFMRERLEAVDAYLEINLTYFLHKVAPVSGVPSLLDVDVTWVIETLKGKTTQTLIVKAPVTSLCPCSKKIADYGAHNQRSEITLKAEIVGDVSIESLARVAEEEASCEVFGLLKRPDEKWVTERAYDNPKFVEDLVRDMALRLAQDPRIGAYSVASENFESIHNHSAYAEITGFGKAAQ